MTSTDIDNTDNTGDPGLDRLILAYGGTLDGPDTRRSLVLKSESDLYMGPDRDPQRMGAADWWEMLTAPAAQFRNGYGPCSRCGTPVTRGGLIKVGNVDGTPANTAPPYTFVCGRKPCVVLV